MEALDALEKLRSTIDQGVMPERATVKWWFTYWMDHADLKPTTLAGYRSYLKTWIVPQIGAVELQKLTPQHLRALYEAMRDAGRSESSVRQCHAIVKRGLTMAVREQRIIRNPAAVVEPPKSERRPHGILTIDEARRVLAVSRTSAERARLSIALMVGLRQGEALGLTWSHVHLDAEVPYVEVAQTLERVGGEFVLGTPKSGASRRRTPITPGVAEILRQHRDATTGEGLVFRAPDGQPVHQRADWQQWSDALQRAGVAHVPLHGARGTAATYLIEQGFNIVAVAQFLGHADPAVTLRHYAHVSARMQMSAMGALDDMLQPAVEA